MEPLLWLALPVVITVIAAVVLIRRDRRGRDPQSRRELQQRQLRRIEEALRRPDPTPVEEVR